MKKTKVFYLLAALICATSTWAVNVNSDQGLRDAIANNANITVTADIILSNSTLEIPADMKVTINLGGHTLDRKLNSREWHTGGQVITVRSGATLNLSNGTLKGGWGGDSGGINNEGGTVNLTDVNITGCTGDNRGGAICNRADGVITMNGGTISANKSKDIKVQDSDEVGGGGIFNAKNATMTLNSVIITDNEATTYGGGGICNYGSLTINNGSILNNTAKKNGGGIWLGSESTASLTINGSTITGNSAGDNGGGIYGNRAFSIQGTNTITGNTKTGGTANNVYLMPNVRMHLTESITGSSIGITKATGIGTFTENYNTYHSGTEPSTFFTADDASFYSVILDDINQAKLSQSDPIYPITTDAQLRRAIAIDGANIKLGADIDLSNSTLSIAEGTTITLDLNSFTLDRKLTERGAGGGQVITVRSGATLNLSNGTLKGGWGGTSGGINNEGGTANLTDVTITGCTGDDSGGGICNRSGSTLTMTRGYLTNNTSNDHGNPSGGGGLFNAEGATATLTGVIITGNKTIVNSGGGICNLGTLTLDGCTIQNNNAAQVGGGVFCNSNYPGKLEMQGANNITDNEANGLTQNVFLKTGQFIVVSGSLTGSTIGVSMETPDVFTRDYSHYHDGVNPQTFFSADLSEIYYPTPTTNNQEVMLDENLIQDLYYIERSWDDVNKKVVAQVVKLSPAEVAKSVNDYKSGTWTEGVYYVKGNVTGVGNIKINGHVRLILCDGASMSMSNGRFDLSTGNTLSIFAQTGGSGKLTIPANSGNNPAIGAYEKACGELNIHGGIITVTGGAGSAGLGSGHESENFGTINIFGGSITARGGEAPGGAGIGGGQYNSYGTLNIYAGNIDAHGGHEAAGIGSGQNGRDGGLSDSRPIINIYGGKITAHGDDYAAGIGGGDYIKGPQQLTIYDGEVYAYGGTDAAGIGGGEGADSGNITVNGGYVYAEGKSNGPGIGSGEDGSFGILTFNGGHVVAKGGDGFTAGIGSGGHGGGTTFIDGDDDRNYANYYGPIVVTGGIVEAWAGGDADDGRAFGADDDDFPLNRNIMPDDFPGLPHRAPLRLWGGGNKGYIIFVDFPMAVYAGNSKESASISLENQRLMDCWYKSYARIEPCKHEGHTYTSTGTTGDDTHTMVCKYCRYAPTEKHTFNHENICTVCGVGATAYTVRIYVPKKINKTTYASETYELKNTYYMAPNTDFTLPECSEQLPVLDFKAWQRAEISTAEYSSSYTDWGGGPELKVGDTYTIQSNIAFIARYELLGVTLQDNASNSLTLAKHGGKTTTQVTISGRTLHKNGSWNTLCLPFSLTAEELEASPLGGGQLMELDIEDEYVGHLTGFDDTTGTLYLNFKAASSIEAGKPYLIKWNNGTDISDPVFENVTINNVLYGVTSEDGKVAFAGYYSPKTYKDEDKSILYLGAENKLYYPSQPMTINAFRCYFKLKGITVGDLPTEARHFVMKFGNLETTGISTTNVTNDTNVNSGWYSLDGRRLSGKPTKKGVYILNGRKRVVK